ncbi:MAG: hypothetical protein R3F59_21845 [Myxococcota bacterium]
MRRLPPEGQGLIMGYGEQLIEQGREEGLQAGREEGLQAGREEGLQAGREEGRLQGEARVLLKQMQLKFGALPEAVATRVEAASEADLERWRSDPHGTDAGGSASPERPEADGQPTALRRTSSRSTSVRPATSTATDSRTSSSRASLVGRYTVELRCTADQLTGSRGSTAGCGSRRT